MGGHKQVIKGWQHIVGHIWAMISHLHLNNIFPTFMNIERVKKTTIFHTKPRLKGKSRSYPIIPTGAIPGTSGKTLISQ
jgi:hypothetical protein